MDAFECLRKAFVVSGESSEACGPGETAFDERPHGEVMIPVNENVEGLIGDVLFGGTKILKHTEVGFPITVERNKFAVDDHSVGKFSLRLFIQTYVLQFV